MVDFHRIIGTLTLLLFLVSAVMYAVEMMRGTNLPYHRIITMAAGTLLLVQYAIGFMILGGTHNPIKAIHWVLALVAVLPVGWEHYATSTQKDHRTKSMMGLLGTGLAFILILAAYGIAEMR